MVLTSVPRQALLLALVAVVIEWTAATHFRGAIIQWRAVDPVNFNGSVSVYSIIISVIYNYCTALLSIHVYYIMNYNIISLHDDVMHYRFSSLIVLPGEVILLDQAT